MDNTDIFNDIFNYIKQYISQKNITQEQVCERCHDKGIKLAQGSVSNMLNKPFSTKLSTLLKVCDGLDLNLLEVYNHVYRTHHGQNPQGKFIYDINDDAYEGYKNNFNIYFLPTNPNNYLQHQGVLHLGDLHNSGECTAELELDTGEKENDETPFIKKYTGQLVISKMGCAYISLICEQYGDMWFLIINHDYLNRKQLICTLANAVTACSGRVRYPTMHRAILSRVELDDYTLEYIRGFLHLSSDEIIISSEQFDKFLSNENFSEKSKAKLISLRDNSDSLFSFSKNILESIFPTSECSYIISKLINYPTAPINNKVTDTDDEHVFQIIKNFIENKN